jgi:hypothetical protein
MVVLGRHDRDRLGHWIDASRAAGRVDGGESVREIRPDRRTAIEIRAAPSLHLCEHATRHDIARRQFSIAMDGQHETLTRPVHQRRAIAAQRLGRERAGSRPISITVG